MAESTQPRSIIASLDDERLGADLAGQFAANRAMAYGDGLFETLACFDGQFEFLDWHLERLIEGAEKLGLPLPELGRIEQRLAALGLREASVVVKLFWFVEQASRGYRRQSDARPRLLLIAYPWSPASALLWQTRWCDLRLASQPKLAGIKHLNRLELVLARAEWETPDIQEGLLMDADSKLVCGTMSNVFVRRAGRLFTPPLESCGIRGVMRRWVLAESEVSERRLSQQDVETADELFLSNSLIGIQPVAALGARLFPSTSEAERLQAMLLGQREQGVTLRAPLQTV